MRVVTFKVDEELLTKLDLYCVNNRKERSEVIREAIKFYLFQQKTLVKKDDN
ncbi:ribbon-helix-helix protein, CopG family [Sulfolobus sp. E5-1-F]|uniref:ribbon-helix-helix protein, CopG family n=1 Tax=Saccharolobus sp. E5-1-F TaxID=2663019 RepID=UPI001297E267|nr:ribbon-helix-helix protein, CopG family [Sulfolobus sp. E5-1-F]QGA54543.1 ribbon-helix-helix protein, CopG family [Sulfolobus sp. E5-1-F]